MSVPAAPPPRRIPVVPVVPAFHPSRPLPSAPLLHHRRLHATSHPLRTPHPRFTSFAPSCLPSGLVRQSFFPTLAVAHPSTSGLNIPRTPLLLQPAPTPQYLLPAAKLPLPQSSTINPRLILCLVPIIGATFPICTKLLFQLPVSLPPSLFNASRLSISLMVFLPTLLRDIRAKSTPSSSTETCTPLTWQRFLPGIELGILMFIANTCQLVGLRYTSAARAAFINQLSTILVPLTAAALGVQILSFTTVVGAIASVLGILVLTTSSAPAGAVILIATWQSYIGDLLEFLSAVFVSGYVLRMHHHTSKRKAATATLSAVSLAGVKVAVQAVLSMAWAAVAGMLMCVGTKTAGTTLVSLGTVMWTPTIILANIGLVVWCGLIGNALLSWLQTRGQAFVPPAETAVLYAAQPIWTALFAAAILREGLGGAGWFGAILVVIGTVVASVPRRRRS